MTNQPETAELIQAAAKLDPSAWLSAEGTPVRLHPDAAAALGGLLVAIAHTDDETLNKASLVRSAAFAAARVVAASSLDAACAHCGSNDHTWDDCEAYTRLTADAYARTLNTPPSAETCAAIRDRLHSGSEPAAVSAAVAPPTNRAAVLREAADRIDNEELPHDYVDMFDNGARWAARLLRRMADETATEQAQAHAPLTEWRVEILDGDEWMPASGLHRDRSQAAEQLRMASERRPLWNDGTPVRRRLVRETTTYTVEAETGPAVGARQDGAET